MIEVVRVDQKNTAGQMKMKRLNKEAWGGTDYFLLPVIKVTHLSLKSQKDRGTSRSLRGRSRPMF